MEKVEVQTFEKHYQKIYEDLIITWSLTRLYIYI
jgi:hypothetical protein